MTHKTEQCPRDTDWALRVTLDEVRIAGMNKLPRDEWVKQARRYFDHYPEQKPDHYDEWVRQEEWLQNEEAAEADLADYEEAMIAAAVKESRRLKEEEDDAKEMSAAARAASR